MIKLIITFTKAVITLLVAVLFSSCVFSADFGDGIKGSGNIVTETRPLTGEFKSLDVSNGIKVIVLQSDETSVTVQTDDNLQRIIETRVENGILVISAKEQYNADDSPVVRVNMPVIEGLIASSGSEISTSGTILSENLLLKTTSGSSADVSVEAENMTIESSSGSEIETRGKALRLETSSSSGSSIDARSLLANSVSAQSSSGSSTDVHPIVDLKAKATSGSSISYFNAPKTISKREASSGGSISQE